MHTAPPVKHEVPVVTPEKAMRTSKETRQRAKELLSTKYVRRFGKDVIDCPVLGKRMNFLDCYICPNFIRRFKGTVHCKGEPLKGISFSSEG